MLPSNRLCRYKSGSNPFTFYSQFKVEFEDLLVLCLLIIGSTIKTDIQSFIQKTHYPPKDFFKSFKIHFEWISKSIKYSRWCFLPSFSFTSSVSEWMITEASWKKAEAGINLAWTRALKVLLEATTLATHISLDSMCRVCFKLRVSTHNVQHTLLSNCTTSKI